MKLAKAFFFLWILTNTVFGQGPEDHSSPVAPHYLVRQYNSEDGLPQNSVKDLLLDPNHFLWISTENGLVRFDGQRFRIYNSATIPGLRSDRFDVLSLTSKNKILLTTGFEPEDHSTQTIDVGAWEAKVIFGTGRTDKMKPNVQPDGKVMFVQLDENKFMVVGTDCRIGFRPLGSHSGDAWQYLKVEEGTYDNGAFILRRILNGDETDWGGPAFGPAPTLLRVTLITR